MSRCLYNSSFDEFIKADSNAIFGTLCDNYHGEALTTTREAWREEISILPHKIHTQNGRKSSKEKATPLSEINVAAVGHFVLIHLDN